MVMGIFVVGAVCLTINLHICIGEAILFLDLYSDPDLFNGPKSTQVRTETEVVLSNISLLYIWHNW